MCLSSVLTRFANVFRFHPNRFSSKRFASSIFPCSQGQAESKKQGSKSSRRHHNGNGNSNGNPTEAMEQNQTVHTKGTAMSFGFRKKLNGTPKKFKKLLEGGDKSATRTDTKDDNGNAGGWRARFSW